MKDGFMKFLKKQSPARIIAAGFALTILFGSFLLMLPCCVRDGVSLSYIDALYTSTSAVCVTGLITVDAYDTFTTLGQIILCILIHIGGLGVTAIGAGIILAMGRRVNLKERSLLREAMNLSSFSGVIRLLKNIFQTTLIFELCGAVLSFIVFVQDYSPLRALWISVFHSIAAFNNAGFDILGNMQSLSAYSGDILLNLVTAALIFFGGIGFLVIRELISKRFRWRKLSMHSRVVLSVSGVLIVVGTLLIKLSEAGNISWLGAFFASVTARTAGFATYSIGGFSNAGLIVMMILMFIGASSGSTGGGIKTSTLFALIQGLKSTATNKSEKAFHYSLPRTAFRKAAVITFVGIGVVLFGSFTMSVLEPHLEIRDILFEVVSAFGTVGLSTGITPDLSVGSKLLSILIMYIGRLGPMTIVTLWYFSQGERTRYPEGNLSIG